MNKINNRVFKASRVTWVGFFINLILTLFKLFAGIVGKSSAMIADAFHSLSDFVTDIVVLLGFKIVKKPIDKTHDYGHGKVETLITTIIGIALLLVGVKIFLGGWVKIIKINKGQDIYSPGLIALYAAIVSIFTKEWLYRYTIKEAKHIDSQAIFANAWHHKSDVLSSIATAIGIGGAILLGERWLVLDPIAAVFVSLFIIKTAVSISKGSINELIDASLSEETENKIFDVVKSVPGVKNPHDMKTRRLGNAIAVDIHIEVDKALNITQAHDVATDVEKKLKKAFGQQTFVSVHIEPSR